MTFFRYLIKYTCQEEINNTISLHNIGKKGKFNMSRKNELDRRRKYYLVLDCETATLPFATKYTSDEKQKISIAKPLIYDLGWTITDKQGRIYKRRSFLISEIFSVPAVFDTAYYAEKRPIYLERLSHGAIDLTTWKQATSILVHDMELVDGVTAYNAMFDFKKAIPFTELYINKLYSPKYQEWEHLQESICDKITKNQYNKNEKNFEPNIFRFRNKEYPLFDLWGLACNYLLNCNEYREMCHKNEWYTNSKKYYKTSAETAYRFCAKTTDFNEEHTALSDAEIESFLFSQIAQKTKGKFEMGIIYFPFKIVGEVTTK